MSSVHCLGPRLAVIVLCGILLCGEAGAADSAPRPNILLLVTDDQRFDSLGYVGNPIVQTPHLDRLARQGQVFSHCFCTTSICAISRASLLTGQYERRHGIDNFSKSLSPDAWEKTFPALLRKQGYRIGFVGKWGVGDALPDKEYDFWRGFPGQGRYFAPGDEEHLTDKQRAQALEFLDGCSAERPFCLQVSFKAPHCQDGATWEHQFPPARRHVELYADVDIPLPATATEEAFDRLPSFLQTSEARRRWGFRFATPDMHRYTVRNYYRLITGVDEAVGAMLKKLDERGLADNTLIVFTSDNGFYLGEHGLAGKWFMHEESIRLPLFFYDPRRERPADERDPAGEFVLNIDLAPTILDIAGLEPPAEMQGRSLRPLVEGEAMPDWRTDFFYEHRFRHETIPVSEGVRTARWKYVRYPEQQPPVEQLFDLESDPREEHDLAGSVEHREQLARLRGRWHELAKTAR